MFIVNSYSLAIVFCFVTMLCWGSWGNTQKLAGKTWRYELFYWDYVIGVLALSLILAFTLGSVGSAGRSFIPDLAQADLKNIGSAFLGGIIFNAANILLSTAIAMVGMAVAFPVGIGLALVLGVIINYLGFQKGDPLFLFLGVGLVTVAILLNAVAYKSVSAENKKVTSKGIINPAQGMMTPYTATVIFSLGIFISNFIFNTILMKRPIHGEPTHYKTYFKGKFPIHLVGILGGIIWGIGNSLNLIAAGKAGAAISYGLGQGATLVAALWGVFIWKEFKGASKKTTFMLVVMFILFLLGIISIIYAGN